MPCEPFPKSLCCRIEQAPVHAVRHGPPRRRAQKSERGKRAQRQGTVANGSDAESGNDDDDDLIGQTDRKAERGIRKGCMTDRPFASPPLPVLWWTDMRGAKGGGYSITSSPRTPPRTARTYQTHVHMNGRFWRKGRYRMHQPASLDRPPPWKRKPPLAAGTNAVVELRDCAYPA